MVKRLIRNRLKCNKCRDIIESKFVHNYVRCKCGACFVDGGLEYQRIGGDLTNLAEWGEFPDEEEEDYERF